MTSAARRMVRRSAAAAFGLLAALLLLEAGLRVLHASRGTYEVSREALDARHDSPWIQSPDPELVYVHRPGIRDAGELKVESHGILRPTEVAERRPEGSLRIAVLGDSVGAAIRLDHAERFPALLERRLAADLGREVEVLNFCVNGYDTVQEARLLETKVDELAPDLVLVVYCLNDPAESIWPVGWFRDPVAPASHALDFLRRGIAAAAGRPVGRALAPGSGPVGIAAEHWRRIYDPAGDGWRSVEAGLDRIAAWSRARGVPVLFAIAPLLLPEDPKGESTAGFRAQAAAAIRARGLEVFDLQDALAAYRVETLRWAPGDIYHFGTAGHVVLAEKLLPEVRRALP